MAKNTISQEILTGTSDSYTSAELQDPYAALRHRPVLDGNPVEDKEGEPSVGNSSATSSESASTVKGYETPNPPEAVRIVENPFEESGQESSTVHSTGGSGQETVEPSTEHTTRPARKAAKAAKPAPPRKTQGRQAATADDDF